MSDYEQTYEEFWKPLVETDGALNVDQVKRELHDFHNLMESAGRVYEAVTGSRVSNVNTLATEVIREYETHVEEMTDEARADGWDDGAADIENGVRTNPYRSTR